MARGGMDPRSVRLDPGGERYFVEVRDGLRRRAQSAPGEPAMAIDADGYVDNSTCPICGARRAAGCAHSGKRRAD